MEMEIMRKMKKEEKAREKEKKKQKALEKETKLKSSKAKDLKPNPKKKDLKKKFEEEENPEDFIDPETLPGEMKKLSPKMPKQYSPSSVEKSWYEWWERSDFFTADSKSTKPAFTIVLPPPNVTGALHIGHALMSAIQDTIIRYKRMSGYNTLWVPGFDHAGIATQSVVENHLVKETGMTNKHDIGRERFLTHVWEWTNKYSGTIQKQLRRLGSSLDWSRECFTMDKQRSEAVTEAFVRLHEAGLIYRDVQLVNWDCFSNAALAKRDVEHIDIKERTLLKVPGYEKEIEFGVITSFAYPLEKEGGGEVVVATTRVETMLGDTAIAVHPDDVRYKHLHGEFALHPFNGRKLPIICDEKLVVPDFGTGCVKITPSHDPNDFAVGKRHDLEFINVFTDDGRINAAAGGVEFTGMPRFTARKAIVEALIKKGLFRGEESNEMKIAICLRSGEIVEPMVKPHWFVRCSEMAKEALDAAENGKIEFIPKQYAAEWRRWLENIHDWCISRQIWWGHRIPAWYVVLEDDEVNAYEDHWVVARSKEEAEREITERRFAGKKVVELVQDPDVLDTWFSSGLFPLSVLGWPEETEDLKAFYPTTVLETGHDILFFWVVRMVMLGMKLGDKVPFRKVYLHPMIRDAHGRKMSKSLGNGIDPLEVINGATLEELHVRLERSNVDPKELVTAKEGQVKDFPKGIPECGADALRFALVSYTAQSDKINMDVNRVVGYRQWCNKLWNAVRFAMMKLGDGYVPPRDVESLGFETMPWSCKWVLSVLDGAVVKTVDSLEAFELSEAANAVYAWWQYEFCDVFIELIKPCFGLDDSGKHARDVLWVCLETGLRLLHPFMPFVTEELWQRLPRESRGKESIMICDYPSAKEEWRDKEVECEMEVVLAAVKTIRAVRAAESLERGRSQHAVAVCGDVSTFGIVESHEVEIRTLADLSSLEVVLKGGGEDKGGCGVVEMVNENLKVCLKVDGGGVVDAEKMRSKIEEKEKLKMKLEKVMSSSVYEEKVPESIKEENMRKLENVLKELRFLNDHIEVL